MGRSGIYEGKLGLLTTSNWNNRLVIDNSMDGIYVFELKYVIFANKTLIWD